MFRECRRIEVWKNSGLTSPGSLCGLGDGDEAVFVWAWIAMKTHHLETVPWKRGAECGLDEVERVVFPERGVVEQIEPAGAVGQFEDDVSLGGNPLPEGLEKGGGVVSVLDDVPYENEVWRAVPLAEVRNDFRGETLLDVFHSGTGMGDAEVLHHVQARGVWETAFLEATEAGVFLVGDPQQA